MPRILTALACSCALIGLPVAGVFAADQVINTPSSLALQQQDLDFVRGAASGGQFEIKSSQYVIDKGITGDARTFAEDMLKDHSALGSKLTELLHGKGITAPDSLNDADAKTLEDLKKTPDTQLGKTYVDDQVAAHDAAVALFEKEEKDGKDVDLVKFATDNLDLLKTHQKHAKAMQ
jgi:putative membrane protein